MSQGKYWNEEIETMPREKLQALQLKRLKEVVKKAYENNRFYRLLYDEAGVHPEDIKSLSDLSKLPFIQKDTVRDAYPYGMLISPIEQCVEMHATSGTTGKSVPVFATRRDLDHWAEVNARELWMVGLRPGDILQNAYGYGLPTGGFGFHYGAMKLGAMVIPTGTGQTQRQIETIMDYGVTAICMTPSYAQYLGQKALEQGIDLTKQSKLKIGLFGAEPWPLATRYKIEELLGITAYDEFGMTEFLGPGMSCECEARQGMHTWADTFLVECINPETGQPVPDGQEGELVWTWLTSEGTAMIRYRSRDLSSVCWEDCPCGRTHPKIAPIKGRTDDAVVIGGLIVFPSQIEDILGSFPEIGANFRLYVDRNVRGLDYFTLSIELKEYGLLEKGELLSLLQRCIREKIKNVIGLLPQNISFVAPDALPRVTSGEGKTASARLEDRRK